MTIQREQAEAMMMDQLYGELPEADRLAFETYLANDADLRAEYESLQNVRQLLARQRSETQPAALALATLPAEVAGSAAPRNQPCHLEIAVQPHCTPEKGTDLFFGRPCPRE